MAISTTTLKKLLNNLNRGFAKEKAGDFLVDQATRQGVTVANAAGANPTKAEFDALLTSLRNAGLIAP